jgi:DNA modification methylase
MPGPSEPVQMYLPDGSPALDRIMRGDLSFKGTTAAHAGHNTHAFAAKFPPQLPQVFIEELTEPREVVLDPMVGSGTAIVEAARAGRTGIGVDIDPLAVRISSAKTTPLDRETAEELADDIVDHAQITLATYGADYHDRVLQSFGTVTREFVEYWFLPETITELGALVTAIAALAPQPYRTFFEVLVSSIVVTKSGGVSLARDLAHSRPHKVESKKVKSAIVAFRDKADRAIAALEEIGGFSGKAVVVRSDSKNLPLLDESVHLIVTSPPYANAIDYVRAHKFSLVWLGCQIDYLAELRRRFIGAEIHPDTPERLKSAAGEATLREIRERDPRRAEIVRRYFQEMTSTLQEMYRVLSRGRSAVVVVGPSTVRGVVVDTALILAEVGESLGFRLAGLRERQIDRDRRLMPMSRVSHEKGIEARIHREHVIAFVKPA